MNVSVRSRVATIVALSLVAVACLAGVTAAPALAAPVEGQPAPAFSGTTIDGEYVSLATYHGRPLVLLFWGSW